ncbi:hypothetical protein FRB99_000721 [Tulasnella sp. 403]|nr:hypothetical protein FRB99_000721 [Tulasnella sp. 403]
MSSSSKSQQPPNLSDTNTVSSRSSSTPTPQPTATPPPTITTSPPSPPITRPVPPKFDLNHFANIFTAFKRRAALDLYVELMASGPGGNGRRPQIPPMGFTGAGPSGFPTGHPGVPNVPPQLGQSYGTTQEGLMMLADAMGRNPQTPSTFPPASSPPSNIPQYYSPYASPHSHGQSSLSPAPQLPWAQGSSSSISGFPVDAQSQQQHVPQGLAGPSQASQFPLMNAQQGFGQAWPSAYHQQNPLADPQSGMGIPPDDIQLNLQAQMLYLQMQQQQLQAAAAAAAVASAGAGPSRIPPNITTGLPIAPGGSVPPLSAGGSVSPSSPLGDMSDSAADEKRKRNTEASARFRQKKKERVQNLSMTLTDLESKALDLEKEASNLRSENTWLKEMVIMKGRRNLELQKSSASRSGQNESSGEDDG